MSEELLFILCNTLNGDFIKILYTQQTGGNVGDGKGGGRYAFNARIDEGDLFLDGERGVLSLFQEFLETFSTVEGLFC